MYSRRALKQTAEKHQNIRSIVTCRYGVDEQKCNYDKIQMLAAGKARGGNVDCGGIHGVILTKSLILLLTSRRYSVIHQEIAYEIYFWVKVKTTVWDTHLNDYAIIKNGKFESKRHISYNADDMFFYSEFE